MPKEPNFALLIGKKLDAKDKGKSSITEDTEDEAKTDVETEDTGELQSMLQSAAADVMAALSSKNVPDFAVALKDFIKLCSEEYEESEDVSAPEMM